ncbi:MAG: hypothetical protein ACYCOU_08900 [Sulfobacillus sp.]
MLKLVDNALLAHSPLTLIFFFLAACVGILVSAALLLTVIGSIGYLISGLCVRNDESEGHQFDPEAHIHKGACEHKHTGPIDPLPTRRIDQAGINQAGIVVMNVPPEKRDVLSVRLSDEPNPPRAVARTPMRTRTDVRQAKRKRAMSKKKAPAAPSTPAKKGKGKGKK